MKKTSYKALVTGIVVVVVLAALLLYFWPRKISDLIDGNKDIQITRIEFGVQNGEPYIDHENFYNLTEEQRQDIMDLFQQYTYRRTLGTLFSDGTLSGGSRDEIIIIYAYEDSELVRTITIPDTGEMVINDRVYAVQEPSELIQDISGIINK